MFFSYSSDIGIVNTDGPESVADEKGFNKMKLAFPVNEGWLFNKDKYAVKLFASYDREEDGTLTFGDRTMIPLACVKKIVKIQ